MALKPAPKAKAEKVEVVTIKHIAAGIAEAHGLTKKQAKKRRKQARIALEMNENKAFHEAQARQWR